MIRVKLEQMSPDHSGFASVVEMGAVPRVGDAIAINQDDGAFSVRSVIWTPGWPEFDVVVRFR